MNKVKLISYLLLAMAAITVLFHGIFLGHPADMRVEASGL